MVLQSLNQLLLTVSANLNKKIVAVAAADEAHTMEAIGHAVKSGVVEPLLFGNTDKIKTLIERFEIPLHPSMIVEAANDSQAAAAAVAAVRDGSADLLMKGKLQTAEIMRAVIDKNQGLLVEGNVISLFSIAQIPAYHKLLVMTDCGIVRNPNLAQKAGIVKNAVQTLHAYGYEQPKVGVMCAIENVDPKMQETVDAAALMEINAKGELPCCMVEGPVSMDIALSAEIAKTKGYTSHIAGDIDVMLLPSVLAGNLVSKALIVLAGMKTISFAVGAAVPLVITSRGASVEEKYNAILAAVATCR